MSTSVKWNLASELSCQSGRRNFALARAAAEAYLGQLDETAVQAAAAGIRIPGRLEVIDQHPLTVLDGAHNAEAMNALIDSLPELLGDRAGSLVAVVSILTDKDAAGMLSLLMPHCQSLVLTSSHNPRALPPATLESLSRQLGGPPTEIVPDPLSAMTRARELAGSDGAVLVAGSLYLVADLVRPAAAQRASIL